MKKTEKVFRPWGGYEIIEKKDTYWIKKLYITPGEQTSLQSHNNRSEVWVVLRGVVRAYKNGVPSVLRVGDVLILKEREKHRLQGVEDAIVLEAALGRPRERDIIRHQDDYGRV